MFSQQIFKYIDKLCPKILNNLSDSKDQVANQAQELIKTLRKIHSDDELLPTFLKALNFSEGGRNQMRIRAAALEVISFLAKDSEAYFNNQQNVKLCL